MFKILGKLANAKKDQTAKKFNGKSGAKKPLKHPKGMSDKEVKKKLDMYAKLSNDKKGKEKIKRVATKFENGMDSRLANRGTQMMLFEVAKNNPKGIHKEDSIDKFRARIERTDQTIRDRAIHAGKNIYNKAGLSKNFNDKSEKRFNPMKSFGDR